MITSEMIKNRGRVLIIEPGRLHPAVSLTRSAGGTYMDNNSVIQVAATNSPRFDYDGAGNYLGLLIEESRTNLIKQSQALSTTPWTNSNITTTSNAATYAGVPYWSLAKTTTGNGANLVQASIFSAVNGTILTLTFACRAGNSSQLGFGLYGSSTTWGGSTGTTVAIVSGPGTVTQVASNIGQCNVTGLSTSVDTIITMTRTYTTTETAHLYFYPDTFASVTSGASNLVTRVQVEAGLFQTSYIPTTTATVTRTADLVAINTPSQIGYNQNAGTVICTASTVYGNPNSAGLFCAGLTARHMYVNGTSLLIYNGTNSTGQTIPIGTTFKAAVSYGTNLEMSINGLTANVAGTTTTLSATALYIGRIATGGNLFNGHIARLVYEPFQRSAANLPKTSV